MRLFASIGIILLVVVLQTNCQGQNPDQTVGPTPQNLDLVSRSVTNLAQKISLAIANPKSKTELFSPVSIAGALSLLLLGSGGTTRNELMNLMGFQNQDITFTDIHKSFGRLFQELVSNDPNMKANIPWRENDKCNNYDDYEDEQYDQQPSTASHHGGSQQRGKRDTDSHFISVANGVFIDSSLQLNPQYENLTRTLYAGEISSKPLLSDPVRSSVDINRWVQQATRNKIREIVSPEQVSNAPILLASAMYFKAKWETMFIEPDTRPRPYFLNGRQSPAVDIDTMATSGCFPFYEDKQLDVKIVGLPYLEGKSTMYIVLPNQSDRQKIRNFQNRVDLSQMNEIINRMVVKTGTVLLPKMKLENTLGLKEVLVSQGLQAIFNPYVSNLTEIADNGQSANNRLGRPTPTPLGGQPIPPSPKPTPPRRPTISQDNSNFSGLNNGDPIVGVNQFGPPANPPPISATSPSSTNAPPTPVHWINDYYCGLANNCKFDGNVCNCYINQQLFQDSKMCYTGRPLTVQQSCPSSNRLSSSNGLVLCVANSYIKFPAQAAQCTDKCVQLDNSCYCCKKDFIQNPVTVRPTQPPFVPGPSVEQQQQQTNQLTGVDIGNRFSGNEYVSPSQPPPQLPCSYRLVCNREKCFYETSCRPLVNPEYVQISRPNNYRGKRQAQTGPAPTNLYVGDVLHKITLDINEQGTEGGAVTAVVIDRISSSFHFKVDGPFLIYLRNDVTKLPLFYGPVFDPRS